MLLTVDIGTSSFKSAVWDFEGGSIGKTAFATVPLSVSVNDGPRHETESGQWLRAFEDCCLKLGTAVLSAAEAVVISGNGPSLVPVLGIGDRGSPAALSAGIRERYSNDDPQSPVPSPQSLLHIPAAPARLWLDRRAAGAAQQVSSLIGGFVDAGFFLPKALDIKTNEPQLYEKTFCFLGCPELLAYALTGEARTVFPSDGFDRWFWNDDVLGRLGLDKEKFPPFIRPGEIFGTIPPSISARFGFKPGIPVIAGGPDFFAAILGTGTVRPGQTCDRAGTSEGINACTENRISDKRLMSYSHPVKPFWNVSGIVSTTGKAVEWARCLLGLNTYDEFFTLAETARAGAGGLVFLPYLAGERAPVWNPAARGVLRGLNLATGRPEFARSVAEGICYAIRDVISVMEGAGAVIGELRSSGASSGNPLLNQIKADITRKKVCSLEYKEAELLGLAVIGACTLGRYASFSEAAGALVRIEKTWYPDDTKAALYDDLFAEYRRTAGTLFTDKL